MSTFKTLALILCLSFAYACGKSGSKSKPDPITEDTIVGLEELEEANNRNYVSACAPFGPQSDNTSTTHTFELKMNGADADFQLNTNFYTANCAMALLSTEFIGHGKFRDNKLKTFEAELTKAHMSSLHYKITVNLNEKAKCGFTNWQTYSQKDILNTDCLKSNKNNFYFDRNGKDIILYSCDEGQPLSSQCDTIVLQKK
jgi:hypothetical protein